MFMHREHSGSHRFSSAWQQVGIGSAEEGNETDTDSGSLISATPRRGIKQAH